MRLLKGIAIGTVMASVMTIGLSPILNDLRTHDHFDLEPRSFTFRVRADKLSCDEPCAIHFWIETDDPTLVSFRWDFNGDGAWDTAWRAETSYDRWIYYDDYIGKVCAEGWDGISTKTVTSSGIVFKGTPVVGLTIYHAASGWKFKPLDNMVVTSLGFWRLNGTYNDLSLRLYDPATGALLGMCRPNGTGGDFWDWCTLYSPIYLYPYKDYIVSCHKSEPSVTP